MKTKLKCNDCPHLCEIVLTDYNMAPIYCPVDSVRVTFNEIKASRKQLTTAPMQANAQTLRSCRNCSMECSINCHMACDKPDYKYWQPRKASA